MRFRKYTAAAAVASLLCFAAGGPTAIAQENVSADESGEIEEILVTGTRRVESLQESGAAITNLFADDFTDIGLTTLDDISAYTPGLNMASEGQPGWGKLNMRGVTQEVGTPIVSIYVDDIPFTNSNIGVANSTSFFEGLLSDVERVEIVRGPQGTLFGANSVGGVIRYVTRDPALDELRGNVTADFTDVSGAGSIGSRYQGNISFPLVKDTLGVTVSAFTSESAGFVDLVDPTGALVESDVNDSDSEGYSLATLWDINDAASLSLRHIHTEMEYSHRGAITYANGVPTYGENRTAETASPFETAYDNTSLALEVNFGWATLNWSFAKVDLDAQNQFDITAQLPPAIFDLGFLGPGMVGQHPDTLDPGNAPHQFFNTAISAFEKDVSEIRLTSADNDTFEWIVGGYYTEEESTDQQVFAPVPPVPNTNYGLFGLPQNYEEWSFFANATFYITPDFDLSAGIRSSDTELNVTTNLAGGLIIGTVDPDAVVTEDVSESETVETYMAGARWRVSDETAFYFRAASGFRPGFINPPLAGSGLLVSSDTMWSYELGAKGRWLGGAIGYDFALWSMTWEDFQAQMSVGGIATAGNANSDINGEGIEGTLHFDPVDDLTVRLTFAYTKSELDEDDPELGGLAGDSTRFVPDLAGSLSARYAFELGSRDASVGGGIRYRGEFETTWSESVFSLITGEFETFTVPSSTLVDFDVTLTGEHFAVSLYANNLLNEYDLANASPTMFGTSANAVRPRAVGVNLSYNF